MIYLNVGYLLGRVGQFNFHTHAPVQKPFYVQYSILDDNKDCLYLDNKIYKLYIIIVLYNTIIILSYVKFTICCVEHLCTKTFEQQCM